MILRIALLLMLAAATVHAGERPKHWAQPIALAALPNLHQVSPVIFRSAQPRDGAQAALDALGIRSVISLRATEDAAQLLPHARRIHAPIESWDVDHAEVVRALKALLDPANQPVLLHCRHGADRTGTVIAAYRMLAEDWSAEAAIAEMREGGFHYHAMWNNMIRYLRKLDVAATRRELGLPAPEAAD